VAIDLDYFIIVCFELTFLLVRKNATM